jgi:hypothetical protein
MKNTLGINGVMLVAAVLLSNYVNASSFTSCKKFDEDNLINGTPIQTSFGRLEFYECTVPSQDDPIKHIVLGGKELLSESKSLWLSEHDKSRNIFIYEGGDNRTSLLGPCTGTQYLLDLRGKKPRMIRFGIQNACNQLEKVTWKKDRVVLDFRRSVRFSYSYTSGEMTLPKNDPNTYDPIFDENSPILDEYFKAKRTPDREYRFAPPYAEEVKLDW